MKNFLKSLGCLGVVFSCLLAGPLLAQVFSVNGVANPYDPRYNDSGYRAEMLRHGVTLPPEARELSEADWANVKVDLYFYLLISKIDSGNDVYNPKLSGPIAELSEKVLERDRISGGAHQGPGVREYFMRGSDKISLPILASDFNGKYFPRMDDNYRRNQAEYQKRAVPSDLMDREFAFNSRREFQVLYDSERDQARALLYLKNLGGALGSANSEPLRYKDYLVAMDYVYQRISEAKKSDFIRDFCGGTAAGALAAVQKMSTARLSFKADNSPKFLPACVGSRSDLLATIIIHPSPSAATSRRLEQGGVDATERAARVARGELEKTGDSGSVPGGVGAQPAADRAEIERMSAQWPSHVNAIAQILKSDFGASDDVALKTAIADAARFCGEAAFRNCDSPYSGIPRCRNLHDAICRADPYLRVQLAFSPPPPAPQSRPDEPGWLDQVATIWNNFWKSEPSKHQVSGSGDWKAAKLAVGRGDAARGARERRARGE